MACARKPQNVDRSTWYYEFPGSVLVVHEVRDKDGNFVQCEQFRIPWRLLEQSRKRRPKRK
jgi:hypothetical protein